MFWYVCAGIFFVAEANKAAVAKQWQGLYKHVFGPVKKWVISCWSNALASGYA
jgi:hypothetical protein